MEKINIAELLKYCPKGMEFDCTMFVNPVKLNNVVDDDEFPITIETTKGCFLTLTEYGTYAEIKEAKCVIFPKGKTTWEGFVPPCKFKVGDKVRHKGATSCGTVYEIEQIKRENNQVKYIICNLYWKNCKCTVTAEDLQPYKEETMKVSEEFFNKYCKKCGSQRCTAEGKWLEACKHYKEETMEETKKNLDWHPTDYLEFVDNDEWADEVELNLGDSYEIQVRGGQTFAIKKQPQYPKTCEECLKILGKTMNSLDNMRGYKYALFMRLQQLLISRDAYWKIAGNWKPYFTNKEQKKFTISIIQDEIEFSGTYVRNSLLAFPTVEMRDAFYENFKELIEQCKELL